MLTLKNSSTKTDTTTNTSPETEQRPRFAIGHVGFAASDVGTLTRFYEQIGMRLVVDMGRMAILELLGGTHIILTPGPGGEGSLDLIVNDIDETWQVMSDIGANPTRIVRGNPHDRFTATDPEGNELVISSTHAIGPV